MKLEVSLSNLDSDIVIVTLSQLLPADLHRRTKKSETNCYTTSSRHSQTNNWPFTSPRTESVLNLSDKYQGGLPETQSAVL